LIGLFGMLTTVFYVRFLEAGRLEHLILHEIFLFGAIFSKETAAVIPVILLSYSLIVAREAGPRRAILLPGIFWMVIFGCWFWLRRGFVNGADTSANLGIQSLIANLPAVPVLVSKFILPIGLAPMPRFTTAATAGGLLVICASIAWAIVTQRIHDRRLL